MKVQINGTVDVPTTSDPEAAEQLVRYILDSAETQGGLSSVNVEVVAAPGEVDGQLALPFEE